MTIAVSAFHLALVAPLFFYVAFTRTSIPAWLFTGLLGLGVFILFYHAYKAYVKMSEGKGAWVNLIHIFLVAPLLIWIGANKKDTPRKYFEMLLMLAFALTGYHLYYLMEESL